MALCGFLVRRLHKTHLPSLLSLATTPPPSLQPKIPAFSLILNVNIFSQTFRRTLSYPPIFPTLQPYSLQNLYNPIDFNDFEAINDQINVLGTVKLVELVHKTKDYTSKKEAIDNLAGCDVKPDANEVYTAIWALRNDWELALLVFEMCEKWEFINAKFLGLVVWVLGSHQKFDMAWSLIRDAHRSVDTRPALLAIIERYAAANYHEKAIKTFHFMEKLTASSDQNALYTLMSALCKYGNVEEAEEVMLKNKKLFPLETEGFNIILHGWCNISVDIFEAKRVWREMASYCVTPDAISYTHMISCISRVGNLFDSLRLYDEMKKRGWVPGLEVYNSLIYVMTRENCLSEALKVLQKIKEMDLQPDSRSYNCLICPLCEADKFEEARGLLTTMTQEGVQPTTETYKAFLNGAELESTLQVLSQMRNDKVGPDSSTFLLIFDKFFKLRQPENVLKVWVEMRHFGVHPESTHYMSLIHGLVNCGCLSKAKEMHTEMIANGIVDDPKLEKLLQGLEGSHHARVAPANSVRRVYETESPTTPSTRPHRGSKKRGDKSSKRPHRPHSGALL